MLAMKTYYFTLGNDPPINLPIISSPVYIKLNGKNINGVNGICHLDSYSKSYLGVLI
ncbi:hypothetical protein RINTHH_14520 [Richelia intracellularis HH01]|uniref:Uncharacterized protein n=2 Tax=Richelia TaxID=98443 RepID=M1WZI1_9NOST|nr:hypothetical protein RINTHH_14520 [Richelia intracellularis HH01]